MLSGVSSSVELANEPLLVALDVVLLITTGASVVPSMFLSDSAIAVSRSSISGCLQPPQPCGNH